jgi:protease II
MRDTGDPAMRGYLAAERAYYEQQMSRTAAVRDRLTAEMSAREVSPDGGLLAYSVDFDGDEVYQLRIRDLVSGEDLVTGTGLPERIERTYYGLAWSVGSRSLLYTVTDAAYRVLFRAELGAGAHVGPAGRYDKLAYEAEILAFILDAPRPR